MHEGIIEKLYQEYTVHGFISEDHIFDVLEENGISLFDVEYICDRLLSKGVQYHIDSMVLPNILFTVSWTVLLATLFICFKGELL